MTHYKKSLLTKFLTKLPKDINHAEYLLPFELLYRHIDSLGSYSFDKDCVKTKLRYYVFSWYKKLPILLTVTHLNLNLMRLTPQSEANNWLSRIDYQYKMKLILANT